MQDKIQFLDATTEIIMFPHHLNKTTREKKNAHNMSIILMNRSNHTPNKKKSICLRGHKQKNENKCGIFFVCVFFLLNAH